MKKLALTLSLLALTGGGLAACGGDDETTSSSTTPSTNASTGDASTVKVTADADGALAYDETELTTTAGPVEIEFDNPASLGHDVVLEDADGNEVTRTEVISGSDDSTGTELEAGEYTFYCSVDSHREAGMEGTLTAQ